MLLLHEFWRGASALLGMLGDVQPGAVPHPHPRGLKLLDDKLRQVRAPSVHAPLHKDEAGLGVGARAHALHHLVRLQHAVQVGLLGVIDHELVEVAGGGARQAKLPTAEQGALSQLRGSQAHGFMHQHGRGAVGEGVVLVQLPSGQVVETGEPEGLLQFLRALAALVQVLQVALLCNEKGTGVVRRLV